jgi:dinuclear metal center YbgI/SA1388 family protein
MSETQGPQERAGRRRGTGVEAQALGAWFDALLEPEHYSDYCPNGLQVEGRRAIRRIASGVTASLALIEAAAERGADALLVHHGWFWRGEPPCLTGLKGARVRALMKSGMHLFAFHLPLDAHPEVGNNAVLGQRLGWSIDGRGGPDRLIVWHDFAQPRDAGRIIAGISRTLGRKALGVGALERPIRRVAWCTGAAQDMIEAAAALGADLYLSGEISERTTHQARELGLAYVAAGHHATERFGVQALGQRAASELGIEHEFIDDPNPV